MKICRYVLAFLSLIFFALPSEAARPEWVDNPGILFPKGEIYALGYGKTLSAAQSDARAGIVKYFETEVNSKFQGSLTGQDDVSTRFSKEEIEENAKGILKGVSITKTYQENGEFYALAVLDKTKTIKELVYEIDQLDAKMKILVDNDLDDKNKLASLEKMFLKRGELNKKHIFLAGNPVKEKVDSSTVLNALKDQKPLSFYLVFKEGREIGITPTKNKLVKMIVDKGFTIANNIEKADRIVTFYATLEEQYLNVEGFVKYKVTFRIECRDGSTTIGAVTKEYMDTGRTIDQVFEKALSQFLPFLSSQGDNLIK
jgi:hypothetical protein